MLFKSLLRVCFPVFAIASSLPAETDSVFYGNPPENNSSAFRIYALGDYLYWQALESNLEYVMKQSHSSSLGVKASVSELDNPFKDGFRIGAGAVFPSYYWQLEFNWTKFDHGFTDSRMQVFGTNPALIALWVHPEIPGFPTWSRASFNWDLDFNTIDFDLLRLGFTGATLSFTPRIGLKRAWINQHVHIRYGRSDGYYDARFTNNFRGLGPRMGFDMRMIAKWGFSFSASAGTALLYGPFSLHRVDVSSLFLSSGINLKEYVYRFKPMMQGLFFVEWSRSFSPAICKLSLALGVEGQVWFGQNQLRTFVSSALPPSNLKANGNLILQGLTAHARFDF